MTTRPNAARRLAALLVAVLGAVLLVAVPAAPASAASASPVFDARMLVLINQARAKAGLPILALYAPLSAQASAWADSGA